MSTDDRTEDAGLRPLEEGVRTDLAAEMTYADYLGLERLLSAQHPLSDHPDELLFIIQHQTTELWFTLVLHELRGVRRYLDEDDVSRARKGLARVKHIFRTLTEQWSVLATLTPTEYGEFRGVLASASGFQSAQYRAVEFLLGNKHPGMLKVFESDPPAHAMLAELLDSPTVYDAFLRQLARQGHPIPAEVLERDVSRPWVQQAALVPVFAEIYGDTETHWAAYATCEDLVDLEDAFQLWRFRHLRTVQRTIGFKTGTGGSSGVGFLKRALDLTFFPELYEVRTVLG
ncbi:MAG: tryptophan 2,3-dioxygenase [Actinomycetes bacterium]|uniref:tryptophan 2,3-dioxygenase n=1 Tax=Nocardioides nematodiphilus TaxID=2849669 RepID=UPI001CD98793|nr:tryptophan 2,3-dioxygenase family protein [Nocardioides nematodiphilus]MCA1981418.1 tryptophan 2,3-dioxygenase [Nocardioides nematodiphilus]